MPTSLEKEISEAAYQLFLSVWKLDKPVRGMTITGTNLIKGEVSAQMSLFDGKINRKKREQLENTIDTLRSRFGHDSLKTADIIDSDIYRHTKHTDINEKKQEM